MPSTPTHTRPMVRPAGVADAWLSGLVRALRIDQSPDGVARLELRLLNHAPRADGGPGPVFDANAPLRPGSAIELAMGDAPALFAGKVHLIEHIHGEGSVPEVVVRAANARQAPPAPDGADVALQLGGNLLSASVIEGPLSLRIEGVSQADPAIGVGCVVAVQGLAPQLASRYRVDAVTQTYDPAQGLRTGFTGVSIPPGTQA